MSVLPGACGLCMGGASGLWALDEGDPPGKKPPGRTPPAHRGRSSNGVHGGERAVGLGGVRTRRDRRGVLATRPLPRGSVSRMAYVALTACLGARVKVDHFSAASAHRVENKGLTNCLKRENKGLHVVVPDPNCDVSYR